jgi:hypothetical protein
VVLARHGLPPAPTHISENVANVAYVASVLETCCKCLFKMFHQTYVAIIFYLDVVYVSHVCCNSMFQMFALFQSYVASGFMLQVASILSRCFMCFTHKLQVYVSNVLCISILMLYSCCKCFTLFSRGKSGPCRLGVRRRGGWQTRVLRVGELEACSSSAAHHSSRVLPMRTNGRRDGARSALVGRDEGGRGRTAH